MMRSDERRRAGVSLLLIPVLAETAALKPSDTAAQPRADSSKRLSTAAAAPQR
jgi:hypothetical protein